MANTMNQPNQQQKRDSEGQFSGDRLQQGQSRDKQEASRDFSREPKQSPSSQSRDKR